MNAMAETPPISFVDRRSSEPSFAPGPERRQFANSHDELSPPRASWPKPSINTSSSIAAALSPTKKCSESWSRLDTGKNKRRIQNEERRSNAAGLPACRHVLRSSFFVLVLPAHSPPPVVRPVATSNS